MQITFRSVMIGVILVPLNTMWLELTEFMWYSGSPTTVSLYPNVIFIIVLVMLGNALVKRFRPGVELGSAELLVIYMMLAVGSSIAGHDMLQGQIAVMSHLRWFGPLEGRYTSFDHMVPSWLIVSDPHALQSAHIGQESVYEPGNFLPWIVPALWWIAFVIALCAVLWGLILVFRKQWTQNEKLAYPIIQVPMLLTTQTRQLTSSRAFWIAFSIAASIDILNGLNKLYPAVPRIPIVQVMNLQTFMPDRPWTAMWPLWVSFYPFIIGLCFFMPLDLAFSMWFFFFFWQAQRVAADYFGMQGAVGFPFVQEQSAGGYYAIAFIALWITRHHMKRLVLLLLGKPVERATPWERTEARLALILILGGFGFLYFFCAQTNMTPWIIIAFFVMYFLISIAITRMRAELGPPTHDLWPMGPQRQLVEIVGAPGMRANYPFDLAMFALLTFFNRVYRNHPMPQGMEGFRIAERTGMSNARLLMAMWIAIVLSAVSTFWAVLWVVNRYGITSEVSALGEMFGREFWSATEGWMTNPPAYHPAPTYAIGVGMLTAFGLAALRMNLPWWPFHPVGYAVSGSWTVTWFWLCVFIAWAAKLIILKYGGPKAYRNAIPFFVGLVIGDLMVGSFWSIYGIIAQRDVYHFWPY